MGKLIQFAHFFYLAQSSVPCDDRERSERLAHVTRSLFWQPLWFVGKAENVIS